MLQTTPIKTRSQSVADDVAALLRARTQCLWIVTREESRVESYLFEAAAAAGSVARFWDVAAGFTQLDGRAVDNIDNIGARDPGVALGEIQARADGQRPGCGRGVWIMRDLAPWLLPPVGLTTQRQLRNIARRTPASRDVVQAIIVLSPSGDVPAELQGQTTVIEWPLPDRDEIGSMLDATLAPYAEDERVTKPSNGERDSAIDAALGLSESEARGCYAKSLVQYRRIDAVAVGKEKKRVITASRVLEWYDPLPGGMEMVGGLDLLKSWLATRRSAYSAKARAYGLPAPKGALLVGVPGCGKSLTAKAIATAWGIPLLRVDLGALKSKYVGESEANLRKVFNVISAIGRCVVWFDELEKSLAGATQGAADGGVSSDALGAVLSWMQERQGEAFVIATCNDVSSLPPELLRKGRFDELFFVDLPNATERAQVLGATLKSFKRDAATIDCRAVAEACEGYTGSEIAALVPDGLFAAFNDSERELSTADLIAAAATVTPLSETAKDKIAALRAWAKGRARPATSAATVTTEKSDKLLDL